MTGIRIDKWLWAARFFKTRMLAAKACELNRVLSNGQPAKAAREVKTGDTLQVTTPGGVFTVEVAQLSDTRGAAPVAQALYRETEQSRGLRAQVAAERKANPPLEDLRAGRPSKRDRRLIHSFRGR